MLHRIKRLSISVTKDELVIPSLVFYRSWRSLKRLWRLRHVCVFFVHCCTKTTLIKTHTHTHTPPCLTPNMSPQPETALIWNMWDTNCHSQSERYDIFISPAEQHRRTSVWEDFFALLLNKSQMLVSISGLVQIQERLYRQKSLNSGCGQYWKAHTDKKICDPELCPRSTNKSSCLLVSPSLGVKRKPLAALWGHVLENWKMHIFLRWHLISKH